MRRVALFLLLALVALAALTPSHNAPATAITLTTVAEAADPAAGDEGGFADEAGDDDDEEFGDEDEDEDEDEDDDATVEDDDDDDADANDDDDDDEESDGGDGSSSDPDKPAVINPAGDETPPPYTAPPATGALFSDSFQSDLSKWTPSSISEYTGSFVIGQGASPTLRGDRALIIPQKARKYGLSSKIDGLSDLGNKALVLQYEVKLEEGMTCGGAYVKLPLVGFKPDELTGDTPYSVMFGPDKCGTTDKVHFIFQSTNPKTGKRTEHHLKNPPNVANSFDKKTHLYTLIVNEDGTFKVRIDNEDKATGSLSDKFEPPVQPPKEIDDADDKKPEDWVDEAKIADPEAVKPDDWDEEAPKQIVDEEAEKPEGWLDDEPEKIADPEAKKPEEWDDAEDGEWEAPMIDNPKCSDVGCGEWKKPMKANPAYKGKWKAPMIDNPKYIGEWKPRKVANPEYYEVEKVGLLGIGGIAFEIWTMDQGVLFDNVWVGSDAEGAEKFANGTFVVKQEVELEKEEKKRAEDEKKAKEKNGKTKGKLGNLGVAMQKIMNGVDRLEAMLAPVEEYLQKVGLEPYLDKLIDIGIEKPMIVVVVVPIVMTLLFLILVSGGKRRGSGQGEESVVTTRVEGEEGETEAEKKKSDGVTEDDVVGEGEGENVERAGEEVGEEGEGGLRRRAVGGGEKEEEEDS